jgi:CHAD domain-containing protein
VASSFTTHREVEIKLDADPHFALPDLTALPGLRQVRAVQIQQLSAFYLDTADLRLAQHGTTFRRRTGGTDEGWHLKLPAGGAARLEVTRPLGDSVRDVPADLLALVRVHLRGEPVAPVAHLTTHRTVHRLLGADDVILADVADDLVTAETLGETMTSSSWREIEVELVDGEPALLDAAHSLLVGGGARTAASASKLERALAGRLSHPPLARIPEALARKGKPAPVNRAPTARQVAFGYLSTQVQALIAYDPHVRLDTPDAVHQMRVATRRLRSALATFRPLLAAGAGDRLREELKWLGGALGAARDTDVMRQNLSAAVEALPADLVLGPVQRRIDLHVAQAHDRAHASVRAALDSDRYLALIADLEEFLASPPLTTLAGRPAREQLRRRVRTACHRLQRTVTALDDLTGSERDLHLHEIRKAAKRARYAAEAARALPGKDGKRAKAVASVMEAIQENLGDHQDAVVERAWLRDLGVQAFLNGENGFTFGLLHGQTLVRAGHDEQLFARLWARAQKTTRRWPTP